MKQYYARRYILFFAGLLLNSLGVAFVTKASLGTSPIAAIPYSLSLIVPKFSLGNWMILYCLVLIATQIILLRKNTEKFELILQVVISAFFGYFIDFFMVCLQNFQPQTYPIKLFSLVVGCVVVAFGAYLEVIADVTMLPGDAFVRAIAKVFHKDYSRIRVISDMSMTILAGLLCLIFLHKLSGVREGTVIAAMITGNILKVFLRFLKPLTLHLLPQEKTNTKEDIK